MNNSSTTNVSFEATSIRVIADGVIGNCLMLLMSTLGMLMCLAQLLTILLYKPLRAAYQILVINAALADGFKSLSNAMMAWKRLCLAALGKSEVISQFNCMLWIYPTTLGTLYGHTAVLALSTERLAVIAAPFWYYKHKRTFSWTSASSSFWISALSALGLYIGASPSLQMLSCNLLSSSTPGYYQFLLYFQNITSGGIVFVNCITGFKLFRRWRSAIRARADMRQFQRDVQLNAVKAVYSMVALGLVSFFGGMVFMASIQDFDSTKRAFYGPFYGCIQLMRSVLDFGLWLAFSENYRKGFRAGLARCKCRCLHQASNRVSPGMAER